MIKDQFDTGLPTECLKELLRLTVRPNVWPAPGPQGHQWCQCMQQDEHGGRKRNSVKIIFLEHLAFLTCMNTANVNNVVTETRKNNQMEKQILRKLKAIAITWAKEKMYSPQWGNHSTRKAVRTLLRITDRLSAITCKRVVKGALYKLCENCLKRCKWMTKLM